MTQQDTTLRRGRPRRENGHTPRIWIEEARIAAGLTQHQLGELCDPQISQNHISNIERGRSGIKPKYAHAIAKALKQTPEWVTYGHSPGGKTVRILGKTRGDDAIHRTDEKRTTPNGVRLDGDVEGYVVDVAFARYQQGDLLICQSEGSPIEECIGRECVVELNEKQYVRIIERGASLRVVTLRPALPTTPSFFDEKPTRICPIVAILPQRPVS